MIVNSLQVFLQFLKIGQRIMAIDYGTKKIGIAFSTCNHTIAMPFKVVNTSSIIIQLEYINIFLRDNNVCAIVVGMPINMDGTKNAQTTIVENFVQKLAKNTNLPIFLQDERLTSKAANNFLKIFSVKRKKRHKLDDLVSASMILETVLISIVNK